MVNKTATHSNPLFTSFLGKPPEAGYCYGKARTKEQTYSIFWGGKKKIPGKIRIGKKSPRAADALCWIAAAWKMLTIPIFCSEERLLF